MNFLLRRMGLAPFDYGPLTDIVINRSDRPGTMSSSAKDRDLHAYSPLEETKRLLRHDACHLAKLYTDNSEFDFFSLWGYSKINFCTGVF